MSLFLGKIHYWLFNKVLWFEGLEDKVIEFSKAKIADVDNLENQITKVRCIGREEDHVFVTKM